MKKILIMCLMLTFTHSYCFAAWFNSSWLNRKSITIQNEKVGANETDFTVLVQLTSDTDLASDAQADGDDILFTSSNGTSQLKHELELFETSDGELVAWVKTDLTSGTDTILYMYYNNSGAAAQEDENNTWNANYTNVHHFDQLGTYINQEDSTVSNEDAIVSGNADFWSYQSKSGDTTRNQGIAWDGTYYYMSGTNVLDKFNTSWVSQTTNGDPCGDTGETGVDHVGDGAVYDGDFYVPIMDWNAGNPPLDEQHIALFDVSDLSYVSHFDVSAQAKDVSGLCIDATAGDNGIIYVVSYSDGDIISKYDLSDGSYLGTIALSSTITECQSITKKNTYFYITSHNVDDNYVYKVKEDGTVLGVMVQSSTTGEIEGLDFKSDDPIVLHTTSGGSDEVLFYVVTEKFGQAQDFDGYADYLSVSYHFPDDGTISFWFYPEVAWYNYNTIWDNNVDANDWECWIYSDGRLAARVDGTAPIYDLDGISGTQNWYKVDFSWDMDGNEILYVNGVSRDTDATSWVEPGTTFYIGGGHASNTYANGRIDEWRVSDVIRDSDWILTSYENQNSPSTFFELGAEEAEAGGWTHKINGVTAANMASVNSVLKASIAEINQT